MLTAVDMLWLSSGMMRVHITFVTTVGLSLDNVTPPQSKRRGACKRLTPNCIEENHLDVVQHNAAHAMQMACSYASRFVCTIAAADWRGYLQLQ
jgi:hypothetical protein